MLDITLKKFGYPDTLVKEYEHWYLLCRFKQVTLGSLILICKDEATAFSEISQGAFDELPIAIKQIEVNLKNLFQNDKINYLMLMMIDPEVHFHVIPRYSSEREFDGVVFHDSEWPKKANIDVVNEVSSVVLQKLATKMHEAFEN